MAFFGLFKDKEIKKDDKEYDSSRESHYKDDKLDEDYVINYNTINNVIPKDINTDFYDDKIREDERDDEEQDIPKDEFEELPVKERKRLNKIGCKFFAPINSNDINNIMHYIRDNNPIVVININKLITTNGMEIAKGHIKKIKDVLAIRKGTIFSFDSDFVICLPNNAQMVKYQPVIEPTPADLKPKNVFGDDEEFDSLINY